MKKVDFNKMYTSKEAAELTGFPAQKFPMKMSGSQLVETARRLAITEFAERNAKAGEGLHR